MKKKWLVLILTVALGAFACGDDHDHDDNNHEHSENNHDHNNENNHDHNNENNHDHNNEEFDPEEEGCEHMAEGPFDSVTADETTPPDIAIEHTRVDVTLVDDGTGQFAGTVSFASGEEAEYLFFLSADVPFAVKDASGAEVALEASADSTLCADDIETILTYDLEVGTYTIELGPTEVSEVGIVFEEAGHGDHDGDHDHDDE